MYPLRVAQRVCCATDDAFNNIYRRERACRVQAAALASGTEPVLPPDSVVEETWRLYRPGVRRRFGILESPGLPATGRGAGGPAARGG